MKHAVILLIAIVFGLVAPLGQAAKFSIVAIPDTQNYAGYEPDIAKAQLEWVANKRERENIVYVASLGDIKDDDFTCDDKPVSGGTEWSVMSDAYDEIGPAATGLSEGIAFGVVPGNHDFDPVDTDSDGIPDSCPDMVTNRPLTVYNNSFGPGRFADPATSVPYSYYGGPRVAGNNEDNFTRFSGCGVDFIAVNLAYRQNPVGTTTDPNFLTNNPEIAWADQQLANAPNRLGILTSHFFMVENVPPGSNSFGSYGAQAAGALLARPNLFLMLAGHWHGESWRSELRPPLNPVQALMSNYQNYAYPSSATPDFGALDWLPSGNAANSDSGFMRIMRFNTVTGMVEVTTFSPQAPALGRPDDLVSNLFLSSGANMSKFTASNFSFPYTGYLDTPPAADEVSISDANGGLVEVGDILNGSYSYVDHDGDAEGATTFRWLRDGVPIAGATSTSYTVAAADVGTRLSFEVTAVAATGPASGCADLSSPANVPADVVLVLDRSGSMGGQSAVTGTKLEAMQSAAKLFIDQIAADGMHRLGLVQFNQAPVAFASADEFPFGTLFASNAGDAKGAVDSIDSGGSTDILEGLEEGVDMLDVDNPAARRIVVLFTDGQHNSPSTLSDADLQTELETRIDAVDTDMKLFSIGFGTAISDVALSGAANGNGGWHVNEVDSLGLAKDFTLAATAVKNDETLVDPVFVLEPGQSETQPVLVSSADRDLTIVVNWDSFDKGRIQTAVYTPGADECRVEAGADEVYRRGGSNYTVLRVALPFMCSGRLRHAGEWRVRVSGSDNYRLAERVNVLAYAASEIRLGVAAALLGSQLEIKSTFGGARLDDVKLTGYLLPPLPATDDSSEADQLGSDPATVASIPAMTLVPREAVEIEIQAAPAGDGYTAAAAIDTDALGLYRLRLVAEATDENGQRLRREAVTSVYQVNAPPKTDKHWMILILIAVLILLLLLYKRLINA